MKFIGNLFLRQLLAVKVIGQVGALCVGSGLTINDLVKVSCA